MASQTSRETKIWTVLELITWSTAYLQEKKIDEARLTAELLLAHALSMKRIQLYMNFDKPLKPDELAAYKALFKRRLEREPVQYIVGSTEFMGLPFAVDPRVLIPRPETEILVEETIRLCKELRSGAPVSLLDIGTGSGCIAVSCAKLIPSSRIAAVDASASALDAARANADRNGAEIAFMHADIFSDEIYQLECGGVSAVHEPQGGREERSGFDAIVSNPPYISCAVYETLQPEITKYEPRSAETDGADGLSFYRRIAVIGKALLARDGFIAVEHAWDQQEAVASIFRSEGWRTIGTVNDYSGHPRCVIARDFA
ncbi:MAG: peptide chain release factor N(5)-glutamine methyltransferase [Acidobacteriota bacterium]